MSATYLKMFGSPVNNYCIITFPCLAFRLKIINRYTQTVFMQIYYVRIREWVRRVVKLNRRAIYFSNSFLKNNALPNVRIADIVFSVMLKMKRYTVRI